MDTEHNEIMGLQGMYSIILNHGKKIHVKYCLTCHSESVHLAKCPHGSIYVEDTSKILKIKILKHKNAVRKNDIKPTVSHFNSSKHLVSLM